MSYPKNIQQFFDEVISELKSVLNPDYILIAGSFGKKAWLYSGDDLISDFEFVFICSKKWSYYKKKKALSFLNKKYPFEISLKGYIKAKESNNITSSFSASKQHYLDLYFFDTFSKPVILFNKDNKPLEIVLNNAKIPVWEAWRLYVNRIGDLLKLKISDKENQEKSRYYWLKVFESTADAYCIVNKIYDKDISERLRIFERETSKVDASLNAICLKSIPIIIQALQARKKHDLLVFENKLNIIEKHEMINSWLEYFEKKLREIENFGAENEFYLAYLKNNTLQNKYLEISGSNGIQFSNLIRLISHPKLVNLNFKFYNYKNSWRHIVLLSISELYKELYLQSSNFSNSKKIISRITKNFSSNNSKSYTNNIINYWEMLR